MDGRILCVDDDRTVLVALRAVLGGLGPNYTILLAESGEEALEIQADLLASGQPLAVVVADFLMPVMRGDEMLVRLHQLNPAAVKILLTGQSGIDGVKRAINHANLYRFLEKPFNNDDLLLTVKSALEAFHQEHKLLLKNQELHALTLAQQKMLEQLDQQCVELARSEAKATVSTLVAGVMHELGTPIGVGVMAASTLVELVKAMKASIQSNRLRKHELDTFVASVEEAGNLVDTNLARASSLVHDFMQMATDQLSERRRVFDLSSTVREVVASLAPSLRGKLQHVVVDIAPDIRMNSLPGALGQVAINLVNNAYLHAFEGRPDGTLTISAQQVGDQVQLDFCDDGVGIPAENLDRLREPFFSTKVGRGGTGLGLYIVENLVRNKLGGTVKIHSTVGQGTTFSIQLPSTLPDI